MTMTEIPALVLPTFRLEQRVIICGPDDFGSRERVGQEGVVAFAAPGDDWLVDFGECQWMWYSGGSLRAVEA